MIPATSAAMDLTEFRSALQQRLNGLSTTGTFNQIHSNQRDVLALTLIGEAAGETFDSRIAVAHAVRNRAIDKQHDPVDVCLQRLQFSCWWERNDNNTRLMKLAAGIIQSPNALSTLTATEGGLVRECRHLAEGVLMGVLRDNTRGSTHYLTTGLYATHPPAWTVGHSPTAIVGHHAFFANIAW